MFSSVQLTSLCTLLHKPTTLFINAVRPFTVVVDLVVREKLVSVTYMTENAYLASKCILVA